MDECSACHVNYFHNPDVRVLFASPCDHRVCEPCKARLWLRGRSRPCPVCGIILRAEDLTEKSREDQQIEREVKVRQRVCEIFCKSEEDFPSAEDYNEYLVQREDIIFKLVSPASQAEAKDTEEQIERYRRENEAQILRAHQAAPRKKLMRIQGIIEAEGDFASSVNAEWTDRAAAAGMAAHPFQARYRDLLASISAGGCRSPVATGRCLEDVSPAAPLPMHGSHGGADVFRQMSGGGQAADTCISKARHYFFADLAAAVTAAAVAAA